MTIDGLAETLLHLFRIMAIAGVFSVFVRNGKAAYRSVTHHIKPLDPIWATIFVWSCSTLWLMIYPVLISPRRYESSAVSAWQAVGYLGLTISSYIILRLRAWLKNADKFGA